MALKRVLASALSTLLAMVSVPALAHDVPPAVVMLDIGRRAIDVELQLPVGDLGGALRLPLADKPDTLLPQYGARIEQYVGGHLRASAPDGRPFALRVDSLAMKRTDNVNFTSNDWVVVHAALQAPDGASTEAFALDYTVILERVLSHEAMVYVRRDLRNGLVGDSPTLIAMAGFGNTHIKVDGSGGSWWKGLGHLFSLGMHHIAEGPDHLLFLLALLLPAPLIAAAGRWYRGKALRAGVGTIVRVVTGFTVGHSISLALASAGWVVAPTRVIEVLIAVSILVSCAHAWRPLFPGREVWIASAFGLVHGLAFAETLAGLDFDALTLALSLVGFNLGIEAMQLLVIAAVLPILLLLGTTRWYTGVRITGAAFAAACAAGWILERAFGLANPLQAVADWLAPPPLWLAGALALAGAGSLAVLRWRAPAAGTRCAVAQGLVDNV